MSYTLGPNFFPHCPRNITGVDWLAKFEDEDRRKTEAEKLAREETERKSLAEGSRFEPARTKLVPLLRDQTANVEQRLGIRLNLAISDRTIRVSAPRPRNSILSSPYPYWFQLSDGDATTVQLQVVDDQHINRAGEPPDDMSYGDFYGTQVTLLNLRVDFDDLLSGDVESLMAWLVACYRKDEGIKQLELKCVQKNRNRADQTAQRKRNNSVAAGLLAFLGVVSIFFNPLGVVALIGGIIVRLRLAQVGQFEGRKASAWAIGLGALTSAFLLFSIVTTMLRQNGIEFGDVRSSSSGVPTSRSANTSGTRDPRLLGKWVGKIDGRPAELRVANSSKWLSGELVYDTNTSSRVAENVSLAVNGDRVVLTGTSYRFLTGGGGFSLDTLEGKFSKNGSRLDGELRDLYGHRLNFELTKTR